MNFKLVHLLADKQFHSGDELGKLMGITRAAVWKQLQKLESLGLEISSVRGKGYKMRTEIELLDSDQIKQFLPETVSLEVFDEIGSTNAYLLDRANQGDYSKSVCLAEMQTAGRGRRGRNWVSPYGKNLYFTIKWPFQSIKHIEGLSLAVGVVLSMVVEEQYGIKTALKWPNDLLIQGQKTAGILVEVAGSLDEGIAAIIGVGVNLQLTETEIEHIGQPASGLHHHVQGQAKMEGLGRNLFAGKLIGQLLEIFTGFEEKGLTPFVDYWNERNAYKDEPIELHFPKEILKGTCRGINAQGELLLEMADGSIKAFASGEISLRPIGSS